MIRQGSMFAAGSFLKSCWKNPILLKHNLTMHEAALNKLKVPKLVKASQLLSGLLLLLGNNNRGALC